jgi:predicted RNA-binding protein with PUA-like domain
MANHWILKTEPSVYSFDRLVKEKTAVWDGVTNPVALKNMRGMAKGDRVLIYHTGDEKAVVGEAEVASAPYPDPKARDPRLVVVDVRARASLPKSVPLDTIRKDAAFKDMALVRMPRLSVVPATPAQYARLLKLGGRE